MKKSRRLRLLALALAFIMVGSSVIYTNLDQEGKKSEEQSVFEDNDVAEIEEVASNELEETESESNQSVKTKDTVNAPEENKDAADAPEENKDAVNAPEENKDTVDTPEENKDTTDKSEENKDTADNDNQEENKGEDDKITSATEMIVVENAETAVSPKMLRAATYGVKSAETGTIVKYFPVTMYDYDKTTINAATDALDSDLKVREGLYFSGGTPGNITKGPVPDLSAFVNGKYYIQNIRAKENHVESWISVEPDGIDKYKIYGKSKDDANVWNLSRNKDGTYSLSTVVGGETYYMFVGKTNDGTDEGIVENKQMIELKEFPSDANGVQICQNNMYLCQWGDPTAKDYGGYNVPDDAGNGMLFYPVGSETPVTPNGTITKITNGYEEWNFWNKASGSNANGDLFYTGLVQNELIDNEIIFNVNEGGIFDSNSTVKSIYEYVGLPFVFDTTTGYYLFDSDVNGAYFAGAPQSGTADNPHNLYFAQKDPQPIPSPVGDGSTKVWLPFNKGNDYTNQVINWHLGMRADLPFSMTTNGRIKATDDESAPITFSFSGDDDVWVFIDGHLVVDLGGIHNRLDVTVDFAANTVTYSEKNSADGNLATGSYNDPEFVTLQKIFTDAEGQGLIDMPRKVFATEDEHMMSVFYLERGEGTSNCKIEFNLPMNDSVIVTKDATQSWSAALEQQDSGSEGVTPLTNAEQAIVDNIQFGFTLYKKNAEGTFSPLANTRYQLIGRAIKEITFGSTDAAGHFYLKNGQSAKFITDIPSEGATYYVVEDAVPNGFVTPDFKYDGKSAGGFGYYTPTYESDGIDRVDNTVEMEKTINLVSSGNLIPEHIINTKATENKSHIVTVYGSIEASDNVEFQCINFVDSEMPNPTATAPEDIIVLDYGLPVKIDPLANDIFRGDSIEIVYIGGPNVVLKEEKDGNLLKSVEIVEEGMSIVKSNGDLPDKSNTINNHKCHFGKMEFENVDYNDSNGKTSIRDTLTYTMNKQLTEVEVISYVVKVKGTAINESTGSVSSNYDYEVGKIYVVPATTMYYEENFGYGEGLTGLVTFTNSANAVWDEEITVTDPNAVSDYQEPGVVGTVADSTYGSDAAYLNDSGDSNGTCRIGSTANGAIRFSYTFTGTGTSIFARTAADTGYMQIKLYKGTTSTGNGYINVVYRDTYYKDENNSVEDDKGTLYNIPVYTEEDLEYGTYTVVVTVAKKGTPTAGNPQGAGDKFYLDGIRIMKPLNESNETVINAVTGETITDKALSAYATDGESQMDVVTLRYKMITDAEDGLIPWNFVVMTDIDGEIITAEDYISIGPKEEVYLNEGQSISFGVKYWHPNGYKLYLGMKAPMGSASVKSGANTKALFNAPDCYYDITGDYTTVLTKYEQAMDAAKRLLYTDETGSTVYEDYVVVDGTKKAVYKYEDDDTVVLDGVELTPMDDITKPYHVAVYTIQSLDGIVSLTNIKAVGNYTFVLTEDINRDKDNGGDNNESSEVYVVKQKANSVSSKAVDAENSEVVDTENSEVVDAENSEAADSENNEVVDAETNETADTDEANIEEDTAIEELDHEESPEETGGENL